MLAAEASPSAPQEATRALDEGLAPRGLLRLAVDPSFSAWDSRYGTRMVDGDVVEETEPLAMELVHDRGAIFPGFRKLEDHIRSLIDDPAFQGSAGVADAAVRQDVTRVDVGASFGVFDWLTMGVTLPLVKTRLALQTSLRTGPGSGADLGVNPATDGSSQVARFLDGLADVSSSAAARASQVCTDGPNSQACRSARELSDRVAAFENDARGAYSSSYLFPMEGSSVADSMAATARRLGEELTAVGLSGLRDMVFATEWFTAEAFARLPTRPEIGASSLAPIDGVWRLGDVEAKLLARVIEGAAGDSAEARPAFAYHLAAGVAVRLGTGAPQSDDMLYDLGSGDGQMDVEGRLVAAMRWRERAGLRLGVRYGVQRAATLERRVAPVEELLAPLATVASVIWTPAPYLGLEAEPHWMVTDELSIFASYRRYSKGADGYALANADAAAASNADPAVLERESARSWQRAGAGLRYSTTDPLGAGTATPIELRFRMLFPIGGSGGHAPAATSVEVGLSVFRSFY